MANPAIAQQIGIMVNANRNLRRSENHAMIKENANAAAHGGIEYNWVLTAGEVDVSQDTP
jgi:hypothetical protein